MQDLSAISDRDLYSEIGRRRAALRRVIKGRPKKLAACPHCRKRFGVAEMRVHQPRCRKEKGK